MEKRITTWYEYVRVYINCPSRHGWIIKLQVLKSEWSNSKYDNFR
jgi:hypothetical protein